MLEVGGDDPPVFDEGGSTKLGGGMTPVDPGGGGQPVEPSGVYSADPDGGPYSVETAVG